jgi:hypothetical protein
MPAYLMFGEFWHVKKNVTALSSNGTVKFLI